MNKNEINNIKFTESNNNKIERSKNTNKNNFDNSVTKIKEITNIKTKPKNKKKYKSIPPHEKPTIENGGYSNNMDDMYGDQTNKPLYSPSFIRPNLESIFNSQDETNPTTMYAYVVREGREGHILLTNLCSDTLFLSDHVWAEPDDDEFIYLYIGQCIQFKGMVYRYLDKKTKTYKYSIKIIDIRDIQIINSMKLPLSINININYAKKAKKIVNKISPRDVVDIVFELKDRIGVISKEFYGSDKFILGMIFNFYYMGTRNKNLSSNEIENDIIKSYDRFMYIFSDVLYRILFGNIRSFIDLQYRVLEICLMAHHMPTNINKWEDGNIYAFKDFCDEYEIKEDHALNVHYKDVYKNYKIRDIKENKSNEIIKNELQESAAYMLYSLYDK